MKNKKATETEVDEVFGPLDNWGPMLSVWLLCQTELSKVVRWKHYLKRGRPWKVRKQTSTQHALSIGRIGDMVCHYVSTNVNLDESLLKTAFGIHDDGEGITRRDVIYRNKSQVTDLEEYNGFVELYSKLEPSLYRMFQKAFLIQYAIKCPSNFPVDAKAIMMLLRKNNYAECMVFDFVERLDYVYYVWEQYLFEGDEEALTQVLRNQVLKINELVTKTNIGLDLIWTAEVRHCFESYISIQNGKWIEPLGKKLRKPENHLVH